MVRGLAAITFRRFVGRDDDAVAGVVVVAVCFVGKDDEDEKMYAA